jgi:hypothetical protein
VSYFTHAANLPVARVPEWRKLPRAACACGCAPPPGWTSRKIALSDLRLYCSANDDVAYRLHELVCGHTLGVVVLPVDTGTAAPQVLDGDCVRAGGLRRRRRAAARHADAALPATACCRSTLPFRSASCSSTSAEPGAGAACHGRQGG